jgi:peptidyl-prolyl cis-trans isomerase SurA
MIKQLRLGLIILSAMFLYGQTVFAKSHGQSLDSIIAIVNDTVITQSDLDKTIAGIKNQLMASNAPVPAPDVLRKQVLEQIINRKLQLQAAEQAGVRIKDEQMDKAISNIAAGNKMSVADLYQRVVAQGMSKEDYRKEIREEMTLQQIAQQEAGAKISITPEEVKSFLRAKSWQKDSNVPAVKEYHVEDLIVLLPETASADQIAAAKKQADDLVTKAHQGMSYSAIASAEATNKTVEESDLGWRKLSEIPSAFAAKIDTMKKGSVIGPIQTANGFHIIHLVDQRQATSTAANNVGTPTESEAQQMLYQQKMDAAVKKWVARLRNQAVINMHPDA